MSFQGSAANVEALIAQNTYNSMIDPAIALYERVVETAEASAEVIDFSGPVGLDVGSADGGWGSVMLGLGVRRVISIDPNRSLLEAGEVMGVIKHRDAYAGTLQQWVAAGNEPAQAVFALNLQHTLINSDRFRAALCSATAIGGLMLATFRERGHMSGFNKFMNTENSGFRNASPQAKSTRKSADESVDYSGVRETTHNAFIQIYRRIV